MAGLFGGTMGFKLGKRSIERLDGVDDDIVKVVKRAIELTSIDFGVTQGLRTVEEQKELVAKGASKTMRSKHLTGKAVDVVAYIGSRISWEITLYDNIAEAMREAAIELGVAIRWGAAWHIPDITKYKGTMQEATDEYVALRVSQGKRPFIDAPHFEGA
jgi:hypothetical protein